jgi:hypothetical protein
MKWQDVNWKYFKNKLYCAAVRAEMWSKTKKNVSGGRGTGQNVHRIPPTGLPLYHYAPYLVFKMLYPQLTQAMRAVLGTSVIRARPESN